MFPKPQKISSKGTPVCWMSQGQKARPSGGADDLSAQLQLSIWLSLFSVISQVPKLGPAKSLTCQ